MIRAASPRALSDSVGQSAIGEWLPITQERIDSFARVTEDQQWIHVDVEQAASGPYGTTIAHGLLTLSLVPRLIRDLLAVDGADAVINYGIDRVRFLSPVPSGTRVRAHVELVEATETAAGVRIRLRNTMELEGAERPAMVAETIHLFV